MLRSKLELSALILSTFSQRAAHKLRVITTFWASVLQQPINVWVVLGETRMPSVQSRLVADDDA